MTALEALERRIAADQRNVDWLRTGGPAHVHATAVVADCARRFVEAHGGGLEARAMDNLRDAVAIAVKAGVLR